MTSPHSLAERVKVVERGGAYVVTLAGLPVGFFAVGSPVNRQRAADELAATLRERPSLADTLLTIARRHAPASEVAHAG